jgi:hypothetical protein
MEKLKFLEQKQLSVNLLDALADSLDASLTELLDEDFMGVLVLSSADY